MIEFVSSRDDEPTDAVLIAGSLAQPTTFESVFDRHFGAIHGYIARRAGPDVADTLASETFCVAFDRRAAYDTDRADARPWLYGIATRLLWRHWRSERRRTSAISRLATRTDVVTVDPQVVALERQPLPEVLRAALAGLAPGDRDVLLLLAWEDLSYEEIAEALEIRAGTVASRLNRARRLVRERLASRPPDDREGGRHDG